jgi:hypothetical protein
MRIKIFQIFLISICCIPFPSSGQDVSSNADDGMTACGWITCNDAANGYCYGIGYYQCEVNITSAYDNPPSCPLGNHFVCTDTYVGTLGGVESGCTYIGNCSLSFINATLSPGQ